MIDRIIGLMTAAQDWWWGVESCVFTTNFIAVLMPFGGLIVRGKL